MTGSAPSGYEVSSPLYPDVVLREASLDDGFDVWTMLREIGPGENGFGNSGYDTPFSQFPRFLQRRMEMKRGYDLLDGRVPMTTYWLYAGNNPVGICKLRHRLTDSLRRIGGHVGYCIRPSERRKGYGHAILGLVLRAARELEIDELLVTCNEDNKPSRRVVEHNGGVLERTDDGHCYYWVSSRADSEREVAHAT